jgi:hypothetical protein
LLLLVLEVVKKMGIARERAAIQAAPLKVYCS